MKKEEVFLDVSCIFFVIYFFFDIRLALLGGGISLIGLPFYYEYKKGKDKEMQVESEQAERRTDIIQANIVDIEKKCQWGENSYCVVCEYLSGSEKFVFRSMQVKYELDLSVGQKIDVLIEPDNLANYYVMLNDYINLAKPQMEGVKIGKAFLLPENLRGITKEKQIYIGVSIFLDILILFALGVLCYRKIITLFQFKVICLVIGACALFARKKVGW